MDRIEQELKGRATLLGASRNHCPDALAPPATFFAPRPLGNPSVDHHKANRLFGQVVGRLDPRRGDEAEIRGAMFAKALGQVAGMFRVWYAGRAGPEHLLPRCFQRFLKTCRSHLLAAVDYGKQFPQRFAEPLAAARRNVVCGSDGTNRPILGVR